MRFAERFVAPNGQTSYPFIVFAGPKVIDDLEAVRSSPAAPGMPKRPRSELTSTKSVDVTLAILSRPILWLLQFFHRFPQLGLRDRPADAVHQAADLLPDAEVAAVGEEDAEAGAQDGGHPQEVRERPAAPVASRR